MVKIFNTEIPIPRKTVFILRWDPVSVDGDKIPISIQERKQWESATIRHDIVHQRPKIDRPRRKSRGANRPSIWVCVPSDNEPALFSVSSENPVYRRTYRQGESSISYIHLRWSGDVIMISRLPTHAMWPQWVSARVSASSSWPTCPWCVIVRRAGLLWSQQDFEWRWSVPLFKCLTVLEFSFILFDLCLLITFFNFIMNYVPIVTFWILTYHEIWILSIMFCFIWSYWIIYFLACLEVSWRVVS